MEVVQKHGRFPEMERVSTVTVTILLAYALARHIDLPAIPIALQLPGFFLSFDINVQNIVAILVAGLTASGANWLVQDHPSLGKRSTAPHWILPALTALTISIPLSQMTGNLFWLVGLLLGGVTIILVLLAEFIVVDPNDIRYQPAAIGLTAVSLALFLILAAALRFSDIRLFLLFPLLSLASGLVSLRALNLRQLGKWSFSNAGVIALLIGQLVAALHYLPVTPVAYGLTLLAPTYALTIFFGNLDDGEPIQQAILEPVIITGLLWIIAFWLG